MSLLENNYLGGSGSRGSGQVKFAKINISKRPLSFYTNDDEEEEIIKESNIKDAIKAVKEI